MNPALLIRLRPTTPWRIGPDSGAQDRAAAVLHSDAIYSAVTLAFDQLGLLEEWLGATAAPYTPPAVRFTSGFPWQRGFLYAPPPAGLWPPPASGRVRWKGAQLVPTSLVSSILRGETPAEEDWTVDGQSACLMPVHSRSNTGPFRFIRRDGAAVDRLSGGLARPYRVAGLQFAPASGIWCAAQFLNEMTYAVWRPRLEAAFRLLADAGLGGLRSRGFGRARTPDFQPGPLEELLFGVQPTPTGNGNWMLSLFSPAGCDSVDWNSGDYSLVERAGRVQSSGELKLVSRLVAEGSVVVSSSPLRGALRNVAPEGAPHPVLRSGYAVSISIPWPVNA